MGGVSRAGFRPGLGLGGRTQVLLIEIIGASVEPGMGAKGLLTVEGVAGVKTGGELVDVGDVPFVETIGRPDATLLRAMALIRGKSEGAKKGDY